MSDKTSEKPLSFKRKATVIDIPTTLQTPEEAQQRRQFIEYNGRSILPQTRSSRGHPYSRDTGQTASGGTGRQRTNRVKEIGGRTRQLNLRPSSEASSSKGTVESRISQFESMAPQSKIPRLNLQRSSAATSKPSDSQDDSVMHIDDSDADPDGATAEAKKLIEVDDVPSPTSARDLTRAASVGRGSPLLEVPHKANESVSRVALRATQYGLGSTAAKVQGFSKQYPGSGTNARLASLRDPSNSLQRMQYSSPLSSLPGNNREDCMDTASIKGLMKPPKTSIAAGLQPKQQQQQQHDSHSSNSIASSPPRLIKPAVNSSSTSATGTASGYSTSARSRRKAAEIYTEYQPTTSPSRPGPVLTGRRRSMDTASIILESPSPPMSPTSPTSPTSAHRFSVGSVRRAKRRQTAAVFDSPRQNIPAKHLTLRGVKIGTHVQQTDMSAVQSAHSTLRLTVNFMRRSFEITGLQDGSVTMKFDANDMDALDYFETNGFVIMRVKPKSTMESVFEELVFDPSSSDMATSTIFMCWQSQSRTDAGVIERIAKVFDAQHAIGTHDLSVYIAVAEELTKAYSIDLISSSEDEQGENISAGASFRKPGLASTLGPASDSAAANRRPFTSGTITSSWQQAPAKDSCCGDDENGDDSGDEWGVKRSTRLRAASNTLTAKPDQFPAAPSSPTSQHRRRPNRTPGGLAEVGSDSSGSDDIVVHKREFSTTDYTLKFEYPLGERKATSVMGSDISRLYRGEFLNDTIMEFYMRYISEDIRRNNPVLHSECFFFNTFFFKKLSSQRSRAAAGPVVRENNPVAALHGQLKRWIGSVDLLAKKYIFVPINENLHWYLAIITNPGLLLGHDDKRSNDIAQGQVKADASELNGTDQGDPKAKPAEAAVSPSRLKSRKTLEEYEINSFFPAQKTSPQRCEHRAASYDSDGDARMGGGMADIADAAAGAVSERRENSGAAAYSSASTSTSASTRTSTSSTSNERGATTMLIPETPSPIVQRAATAGYSTRVERGNCSFVDLSSPPTLGSQDHYQRSRENGEASPRDGAAPEPVVIRFKNSEFKITAAKYKDPSKHPYILILDSLGSKHQTTFKLLREYINSEVESRSPPAAAGSSDAAAEPASERLRVTGRYAMVPLQTNMCDCGVFVLHYVEEFLRDPQTLLALAVNNVSLREWFAPGLMRQKRKGMLDLATDLARAYAEAKQCGENGGAAAGSTIGDLGTTPPLLAEPKQDGAMGTGDSDGSMATALGDTAAAGSAAVSADAAAEKSARNGGSAPDDLRDATAAAAKIGAESDDFQ